VTTARIAKRSLRLLGSGIALPGAPLTTSELLARIEQNFEISQRTGAALSKRLGIRSRYHARDWRQRLEAPRPGHRNPELAAMAVIDALAQANLSPRQLQYLIGHTTTPGRLLPPNISEVANRIGLEAPYGELRQACTGFANALQWASGLLMADAAPIAIVGSEVGSVFLDPLSLHSENGQWVNLMQMGDGAGAAVIGPDDGSPGARLEHLFFGHIGLDRQPGFTLEEGGSDYPAVRQGRVTASFHHEFESVKEDGLSLFEAGLEAARSAGVDLATIELVLPHQANGRIGDWLARALKLPPSLFWGNAEHVGNLGSAAIWVALHELRSSGRLRSGDRVLVLGAEATHYLFGGFVYVHG